MRRFHETDLISLEESYVLESGSPGAVFLSEDRAGRMPQQSWNSGLQGCPLDGLVLTTPSFCCSPVSRVGVALGLESGVTFGGLGSLAAGGGGSLRGVRGGWDGVVLSPGPESSLRPPPLPALPFCAGSSFGFFGVSVPGGVVPGVPGGDVDVLGLGLGDLLVEGVGRGSSS